jgi:hypothetical protein
MIELSRDGDIHILTMNDGRALGGRGARIRRVSAPAPATRIAARGEDGLS